MIVGCAFIAGSKLDTLALVAILMYGNANLATNLQVSQIAVFPLAHFCLYKQQEQEQQEFSIFTTTQLHKFHVQIEVQCLSVNMQSHFKRLRVIKMAPCLLWVLQLGFSNGVTRQALLLGLCNIKASVPLKSCATFLVLCI